MADTTHTVAVDVTYTLTKTNDVSFVANSFIIGDTPIDLAGDKDDNNTFTSKHPYHCLRQSNGLHVILGAFGHVGGSWKLEIKVDGTDLNDNPITENIGGTGHVDHNAFHS